MEALEERISELQGQLSESELDIVQVCPGKSSLSGADCNGVSCIATTFVRSLTLSVPRPHADERAAQWLVALQRDMHAHPCNSCDRCRKPAGLQTEGEGRHSVVWGCCGPVMCSVAVHAFAQWLGPSWSPLPSGLHPQTWVSSARLSLSALAVFKFSAFISSAHVPGFAESQTKAELTTLTNYLRDPETLAVRARRQLRDSPWQKPVKAELEVRCVTAGPCSRAQHFAASATKGQTLS